MKTDDLIKGLSADATARDMPLGRAWAMAGMAAIVLAAGAFMVLLGPRADIGDAMHTTRFLFKFVVTIGLAVTAWMVADALSRPDGSVRVLAWLLLAPIVLLGAAAVEMAILPEGEAMPRMMGTNSMLCLLAIPAIGLLPLGVFLAVLRHGAPARVGAAGAVAGVLSAGVAATFYAAHCIDDSPLFVVVWYSLATLILALVGYVAARLTVRW